MADISLSAVFPVRYWGPRSLVSGRLVMRNSATIIETGCGRGGTDHDHRLFFSYFHESQSSINPFHKSDKYTSHFTQPLQHAVTSSLSADSVITNHDSQHWKSVNHRSQLKMISRITTELFCFSQITDWSWIMVNHGSPITSSPPCWKLWLTKWLSYKDILYLHNNHNA